MNTPLEFAGANARYSVLAWEPMGGSGERINVGAVIEFAGRVAVKSLVREDVLRCMYGTAGDNAAAMIATYSTALNTIGSERGFDAAVGAQVVSTIQSSSAREAWATDERDLLRQIVLMHCSLSSLVEYPLATAEDVAASDREVNQQWATKVKLAIQEKRPDLSLYLDQAAVLVDGGEPVKFGMLSSRLAANFGIVRPHSLNQDVETARAKMWKLALAKERYPVLNASLICGAPRKDDVTLTDRQLERLQSNLRELDIESAARSVSVRQVHTFEDAAAEAIALA